MKVPERSPKIPGFMIQEITSQRYRKDCQEREKSFEEAVMGQQNNIWNRMPVDSQKLTTLLSQESEVGEILLWLPIKYQRFMDFLFIIILQT